MPVVAKSAAGVCYILNSISDLAVPAFARMLSSHLMDPTLIGEAALALWLLVFGAGSRSERER